MNQLRALLSSFEDSLRASRLKATRYLQQGLDESIITTALQNGFNQYEIIAELYKWCNGVNDDSRMKPLDELELFPFGVMLSFDEALATHNIYQRSGLNCFEFQFPLFDRGGDCLLINLNFESNDFGKISLSSKAINLSPCPVSYYDSLELMFHTIIKCFQDGAYRADESGLLGVDYDLETKISRQLNPEAEFWKE